MRCLYVSVYICKEIVYKKSVVIEFFWESEVFMNGYNFVFILFVVRERDIM